MLSTIRLSDFCKDSFVFPVRSALDFYFNLVFLCVFLYCIVIYFYLIDNYLDIDNKKNICILIIEVLPSHPIHPDVVVSASIPRWVFGSNWGKKWLRVSREVLKCLVSLPEVD